MDPSSLIFVAIIAIWAAYLLGHWVRRRDQLATARSIDRFSSAMRVLERRAPMPALAQPQARGYVVAPVRPVYARMASSTQGTPRSRTSAPPEVRPPAPGEGGRHTRPGVDVRARSAHRAAVRRRRLLVALTALTLTGWLLAVGAVLAWWVAAVPTVVLGAFVARLRALSRQRAQRHRRERASQQRQASRAGRESMRTVVGHVVASRGQRLVASAQRAGLASEPGHAQERTEPPVEVSEGHQQPERPVADDTSGAQQPVLAADGWQPVPVPPPTYTLKPKAPTVIQARTAPTPATSGPQASGPNGHDTDGSERDAGQPGVPAAGAPAPAVAFDLDEILERRIASGA